MNKKLLGRSFVHAFLAFLYIVGIAAFFHFGLATAFVRVPEFFAPVIILSLLVLSASIMAILVFGKPVLLYLDNQKKDAITLLFYTVSWLAIIFLLTLVSVLMGY